LWIAFKICIFDFQKQQNENGIKKVYCCELLSKFVSLTFRNSGIRDKTNETEVVNCFQNLYLWLSETAGSTGVACKNTLWIAFKICIFDFQKQLIGFTICASFCCELLSKFVSLTFRNSHSFTCNKFVLVVNCFQNLYLWLSETAVWRWEWERFSCELLSKFVSLTFRNS